MSIASTPRDAQEKGARTSALLLRAVEGDSERISVGQILDALDARAFGLAILVFSLPSIAPMPPGVPTVVGVALLIVAIQMLLARHELWLPGFLSKRSFPRPMLVSAFQKFGRTLETVEKIMKPRLLFMTGPVGTFLIGVIVLVMAVVLILPLPFGGNLPPALACAVLGMGLAERDGAVVLVGVVASIAATIAVTALTVTFLDALPAMIDWTAATARNVAAWFIGLF
ncbi:MAG: exopolysaccharide biosynthesis protein [Alphaproteobacteria bacterium]|nr:exopolysaccharide biosynthesis protein [Alphaproteobacteria bacterium]